MAHSANQEQVFSPLDQSGVSNFALGERKIKKKCPLFRPITFSNFALYVITGIIHHSHVNIGNSYEVFQLLKFVLFSTLIR